jgi:hypothetical protein
MRIAYFCFIAAAAAALCGMSLGFYMGMVRDFTLTAVHAHINLLGWVTLALYGLYHRGVPVMTGGLAGYLLTHAEPFIPAVFVGGALAIAGMALFLAVVLADMRAVAEAAPALRPRAA